MKKILKSLIALLLVVLLLPMFSIQNIFAAENDAKTKASDFNTSDFGDTAMKFDSPYKSPDVYPTKGEHPRVMVSSHNIDEIRDNLTKKQNTSAYKWYLSMSNASIPERYSNIERDTRIEAKAFRYLMTGEEKYGYEAIYYIKDMILNVNVTTSDPYREYGLVMYTAACVYDWCYDLLTEADKEQIINGVINNLATKMEVGCPPSGGGTIAHHTVECQILRSYLSFAIAVYDERPDIYEYVAGRIFEEIVPSQNFILSSGKHHEGAYYGPFRYCNLLDAQALILAMTKGKTELFDSKSLQKVASSFLDFSLPGFTYDRIHVFEIGDVAATSWGDYYSAFFLSSALFGNAAQKGFSYNFYNNNTNFISTINNTYISAVRYLILNDPDLEPADPFEGRELVNITSYPASAIFARSAWNDKNAVAVYMTMPEFYSASHSHAEAGSFQIYYKGMLASDSGYYTTHGWGHHGAYTRQTIASNSLLIYNPNLEKTGGWNDHVYSGGQSLIQDGSRITTPYTLDAAMESASMDQLTILGKAAKVENNEYIFSYLAGDMTKVYDEETVDEVTRHMLSVMTDDNKAPMVFVTFDRITSDDASYKKTFLLHSMTEPEITDDGYVIITNDKNGNSGKIIAQSLVTDMDCTVWGDGNGTEYTINGTVHKPDSYKTTDPDYRIELSPAEASKTDYLLTVMYVTDATNKATPVKADEIQTNELIGASIFNKALLFAKEQGKLTTSFTVTVNGENEIDYYIGGVADGKWNVKVDGKTVKTVSSANGEGILSFTAPAGKLTVEPVELTPDTSDTQSGCKTTVSLAGLSSVAVAGACATFVAKKKKKDEEV